MIHRIRVIFGDTDQMGIVYYANYMRYFEAARAAFLRGMGRSQADLQTWGVGLPVVEAHCVYKRSAHYEDVIDVHVAIDQVGAASMRFMYELYREDTKLAHGYTRHACVDDRGKPMRMPAPLRALVDASQAEPADRVVE